MRKKKKDSIYIQYNRMSCPYKKAGQLSRVLPTSSKCPHARDEAHLMNAFCVCINNRRLYVATLPIEQIFYPNNDSSLGQHVTLMYSPLARMFSTPWPAEQINKQVYCCLYCFVHDAQRQTTMDTSASTSTSLQRAPRQILLCTLRHHQHSLQVANLCFGQNKHN